MLNFSNFREKNEYRKILTNSFPASLKNDVMHVAKILPFNDKNTISNDGKKYKIDSLIHSWFEVVKLNNEEIKVPCRIYINEPKENDERKLSDIQKDILNCIFLCHNNGYTRQRRLEKLANSANEFIIPFTFKLLGEYVIEILEVLDQLINENSIPNYAKFINCNQKYWVKTQSRVVSYWNEYYRYPSCYNIQDYVGYKITSRLNSFLPTI
jgi:hypothetical protein